MFIYAIVCSETLKIYVGQHKGDNLQKYLQTKQSNARRNSGTRSHLFAAMRKHPKETWGICPLVSNVQTRAELDELEKHFIRVLKTQHPDVGYNICDGGEGFTGPHTEEWKQQQSARLQSYYNAGGQAGMKGKKQSEKWKMMRRELGPQFHPSVEHREKLRQANLGKKKSTTSRQKMSEARSGKYRGPKNPFFGRHHSEESKRKNADAHRKTASAETKAKMSAAQKARQVKIRLSIP